MYRTTLYFVALSSMTDTSDWVRYCAISVTCVDLLRDRGSLSSTFLNSPGTAGNRCIVRLEMTANLGSQHNMLIWYVLAS